MSTSRVEMKATDAVNVAVTDEALTVELSDGRTISVPLAWYPRLLHATTKERANWRLIGKGQGIHWDDLDEDISVENLLAGRRSGESQASLKRWLEGRRKVGKLNPIADITFENESRLPAYGWGTREGGALVRKVRSDKTVGKVEKDLGLSTGAIRNKDGRDARSDKKIGTIRKEQHK